MKGEESSVGGDSVGNDSGLGGGGDKGGGNDAGWTGASGGIDIGSATGGGDSGGIGPGSATGGGDSGGLFGGLGDLFGGGGNVSGPGPVGGDSGLPGAGGGSNTPFAGIPGLSDNLVNGDSIIYGGGGVSSFADPASDGSAVPSVDSLFGGGATPSGGGSSSALTSGISAGSTAAPAGTSGLPDLSTNTNEVKSVGNAGTGNNAGSGGTSLLDQLGLSVNKPGAMVAAAGLLNNLINGNRESSSSAALRELAGQAANMQQEIRTKSAPFEAAGATQIAQGQSLTQEGQALTQFLKDGTLPAGYEQKVQEGVQAAIARTIANHANRGMPTDPTRNSVLAEEIRQIEARVPEMRLSLAQGLAQSGTGIIGAGNQTISTGATTAQSLMDEGIRTLGLSSDIYKTLAGIDTAQQNRTGQAIANFASALNSTPKKAA